MPHDPEGRRSLLHLPRASATALVISVLALATSLAGNTLAAVIISSNHQVAAGTIAGTDAPTGDNKNLIAGSVGSTDLHSGAVTPAKLSGDARAHKIDFIHTGSGITQVTLLSLDELTIHGGCYPESGDVGFYPFYVSSSVAGDLNWSYIEDNAGTTSVHAAGTGMAASTPYTPFGGPLAASSVGAGDRLEGQLIYANSKRVITVTFHLIAEYDINSLCEMTGSALVATKA